MKPLGVSPARDVTNQTPPLVNYNLFSTDPLLVAALDREGAAWARSRVEEFGREFGTEEVIRWGFQANENVPALRTHDRVGNRIDEIEFHPAWHNLLTLSIRAGLHSMPWSEPRPGAHVARTAMMMLAAQNEAGHLCPVSMTYSAGPALRKEARVAAEWEPRILSTEYDSRSLPAAQKRGALIGLAIAERQGGSR